MVHLVMMVVVDGRPEYRDRIPNGYNVQDSSGNPWPGVGHSRSTGGGSRNPFGEDFLAAGFRWTAGLCRLDSDGDGATNGAELGDPDCVWTPGVTPAGPAVSHPGIHGDAIIDTCKNFEEPSGAVNLNIQFTQAFELPANMTTSYARQAFSLPLSPDWVPVSSELMVTSLI
jgi:hypothetical protein